MKNTTKITLVFLILILFFVWVSVEKSPNDPYVHTYFLNVGQGDSILIEKGDFQVLIDGGPDDTVLSELGKAMPIYDRKIEIVILTHPHADHLTGLNLVLDRYQVEKIYGTGVLYETNTYLNFLNKIKDSQDNPVGSTVPKIGEKIQLFGNGSLEFLWPGDMYNQKTEENLNDTSIVTKFCYISSCALLMGDMETDEQKKMIDSGSNLSADLLKVAHHGSENGTNLLLLEKVNPIYAVISVGKDNKFGHPHQSIVDLIKGKNIELFRTDQKGKIEFVISPDGIVPK